jgi:UDP-N-acetylmuramyl pentapeptide phosphotransferase/UDP-N-acetylglucosamine-1-phosphate transferase
MIEHVVAFLAGALAAALLWQLSKGIFTAPVLARRNVRGLEVPTAGGIVVVLAILVVGVAARQLLILGEYQWAGWLTAASSILFVVAMFGFLGLVDDLIATGDDRGFRGHVSALVRGRLTTGGLKLVGGGLVAMYLAFDVHDLFESSVNVLVIALAANTANLLDRAPGRLTKTSMLVLAVILGVNGLALELTSLTLVVGATFGLLVVELEERVMLGDTGANPLGAVFGLAIVQMSGTAVTVAVLVVLVVLNVVSERVSFSAVISRNRVLRWYDELGRTVDPS